MRSVSVYRPKPTKVVGPGRFELPTSRLSSARSNQLSYGPSPEMSFIMESAGRRASRLAPNHLPNTHTRYWWSWTESNRRPPACKAGALPTELQPQFGVGRQRGKTLCPLVSGYGKGCAGGGSPSISRAVVVRFIQNVAASDFLRKEVIQPQVPLRLPCYDFTPVADLTVDGCLLAVSAPASGKTNSHGVTGGVYKARERIHRGMLIRDY